jgi:hypothetical protein
VDISAFSISLAAAAITAEVSFTPDAISHRSAHQDGDRLRCGLRELRVGIRRGPTHSGGGRAGVFAPGACPARHCLGAPPAAVDDLIAVIRRLLSR